MNKQPNNGDVLRVNRGFYSHYGIFVKDGEHVIHYTGATGPKDFNGMVRETSLKEFLNDAEDFSVVNFLSKEKLIWQSFPIGPGIFKARQFLKLMRLKNYHLYSGDETVARARSRLGELGYNLALNNCEHFAVWCKTGVQSSSQVDNVLDMMTTIFFKTAP